MKKEVGLIISTGCASVSRGTELILGGARECCVAHNIVEGGSSP
jgi:hypothetical protein